VNTFLEIQKNDSISENSKKKDFELKNNENYSKEKMSVGIKYCQTCGQKLDKGTNFCPNCGQPIVQPFNQPYMYQQSSMPYPSQISPGMSPGSIGPYGQPFLGRKTGLPVVGGILILIAAVWCLVEGLLIVFLGIFSHWWYWGGYFWGWGGIVIMIVVAVFEFWGFAIGLTGAILTFKRIKFPIAIVGASFVIVAGGLAIFGTSVLGIIILILGILGTIFTALAKNEFH